MNSRSYQPQQLSDQDSKTIQAAIDAFVGTTPYSLNSGVAFAVANSDFSATTAEMTIYGHKGVEC